jgi:hypothetical protein
VKDAHRYEIIDEERRFEWQSSDAFDRLAFAMRVLAILRPRMTVAVYARQRHLKIESGRDLANDPNGMWAMVGIPPNASKEHIARALAELAGCANAPFIVDLIAHANSVAHVLSTH